MKYLVSPNFWFRGAIILGLLLALLLLVQSVVVYLHVSRRLVMDQSIKEAERQAAALEQELRSAQWDAQYVKEALEEAVQEGSNKFAWIRIVDLASRETIQAGNVQITQRPVQDSRTEFGERSRSFQVSDPSGRQVMVTVLPFRMRRVRGVADLPQTQQRAPAPAPPRVRLIEIAVYLDSVAGAFGPLRRDLIINCLAAVGLAGSMVLFWLQFPRYIRGKQLEQQLELAHRVQTDLLPSADTSFKRWDIAASCIPALQVGGDFYDVFLTDRGHIALVLGDVSGKGIPAALLMGLLHGAVRSISWSDTPDDHESSSRRLNDLLNDRTSPERFASLFWAYHEPETQSLRYVNAGHLPPAIIRRTGAGEFAIQRLDQGGPILGAMSEASYRQGTASICPGDILVLYSDGIVEVTGGTDEEFGEERLWELVRNNWTRPASAIRDEILSQVRTFLQRRQPPDDMTLMVARVGNGDNSRDEPSPA